ncbi:glycoside hydrolase family 95 protein [Nonomuraea sp. NPDC000554]|uniref:glycoside hydrolase family 95 protein n=1 Tax=Nonomuraea sp. NPDC000554 TaxID=3154259 RepID=UPI003326CCD4
MKRALLAVLLATTPLTVPATAAATAAAVSSPLTLWYDEPATNWEQRALPIGNGALGGMVFGGVSTERLQLNEKTLWTGGIGSNNGNWRSPRPGALDEVRSTIATQGQADPDWVAGKLGQPRVGYGSYQTFGDLWFDVPSGDAVTGYRRELDLSTGLATVRYTVGKVTYTREYLASYPDNVIVARFTADKPGKVALTTRFTTPHANAKITAADGRITVRGALADNGLTYEGQIRVLNEGGTRTDETERVSVSGANAVTVVFAAGTNYADTYPAYRGADPAARVTTTVDDAAAKPYGKLRRAHVADYRRLFDRVRLDLGQGVPQIPTDDLLAAYDGGDRALEVLFFQYGRYLLIASSRDNSPLPANLQGVWNQSTAAPWSADYHTNINVQMNYWPAEVTNLSETTRPLFDFVDALRPPGRVTAREMFGADGWVVHNETNPFGFTGVHDWSTAFWFPEAGAWLAQHAYEHYLFTKDEAFLRDRAYPLLKETARFWLDYLVQDADGKLVASPSYSPEHGPFTAGAAMSQQIVWDLFTNVLEAAKVLGTEEPEVAAALAELDPGLRVGRFGQLQEWKRDLDSPTDTHRHVSHLFALYPGRQIGGDPALTQAARTSLIARGNGEATGWANAWKAAFWARLRDGDQAFAQYRTQLRQNTMPNLWDKVFPSGTFQIDANLGSTAAVAEMLLQSHTGVIDVLPALPGAWSERGSFDGLRARGAFTVGATWQQGALTEIRLASDRGGPARLRFPGDVRVTGADGNAVDHSRAADGTITFLTKAGASYRIVSANPGRR